MTRRKVAVIVAVVLFAGSFGVLKGAFFARSFVSDQLAEQKISFSPYDKDQETFDALGLKQYAGKQVTNGWEARQYANVIEHHIGKATGGKTYSEMSSIARANPTDTKLQEARRTALDGQLLRGTLLNVYGWWWIGTIALWAGWIMVILGVAALVVAALPSRKPAEA